MRRCYIRAGELRWDSQKLVLLVRRSTADWSFPSVALKIQAHGKSAFVYMKRSLRVGSINSKGMGRVLELRVQINKKKKQIIEIILIGADNVIKFITQCNVFVKEKNWLIYAVKEIRLFYSLYF